MFGHLFKTIFQTMQKYDLNRINVRRLNTNYQFDQL